MEALGVKLPPYTAARLTSADLTDIRPAEYRADVVVQLLNGDEPIWVLVVEVQLGVDPRIVKAVTYYRPLGGSFPRISRSASRAPTVRPRAWPTKKPTRKAATRGIVAKMRMRSNSRGPMRPM